VSGGFNIYPREIEDILASHPAVSQVAVIGVPHPKWGEAVKAVVVLRPGQSATAKELTASPTARSQLFLPASNDPQLKHVLDYTTRQIRARLPVSPERNRSHPRRETAAVSSRSSA